MAFERDFQHAGLFRVEIEGVDVGQFQEVTLPEISVEVIQYHHGQQKTARKRPGEVKYGNLTLKRGYSDNRVLQEWWENIAAGVQDRRAISIIHVNEEDGETMRWNVFDAWPCKWKHSGLAGSKNEIAVEELEICLEYMERGA